MVFAGSSVWPRAASLVGGAVVGPLGYQNSVASSGAWPGSSGDVPRGLAQPPPVRGRHTAAGTTAVVF